MTKAALIQGRYQLLDLIGRGGMGEVWRARDEALGRQVAVKCLKPAGVRGDSAVLRALRERFRREARVAAALQHRGVTVVHDFGAHDGVLYLVMELLEGHNLSQLLGPPRGGPLPVDEVLDIAVQIAAALAYTHDQGIVHRDLKPANVMRTADGTVKICDFGIARLGHDIGFTSKLNGSGVAMGTPHYMSPEQIADAEVDHRSDLYSLGCVLYEIATGVPPFEGDDAWAVLVGHRDTAPRPPRAHRRALPPALEKIILALLAKEPQSRPASAAELGRMLAAARARDPRTGPARPGGHPPAGAAASGGPGPADDSPLPGWTHGMTGGGPAAPAGPPPGTDDEWTGPVEPPLVAAPRTGASGPAVPARPPSPPPAADGTAPVDGAVAEAVRLHAEGRRLARAGHWPEAGEYFRQAAEARGRSLGADHPDTLASRYETGFALCRQGRYAAALDTYAQVAGARARDLGPEHPETLAARQESAYVLGRLRRHQEAHRVYTEVLAVRERTMGAEHPETLRCRHNLAVSLKRLGRLEESYLMLREVAAARARVLGTDRPETLVTRQEAAYTLGRMGRWTEALRLCREVAGSRARTLGEEHPDTLAARYETGICLGKLGRAEEALDLFRLLVRARTRTEGARSAETLRARHALGVNLGRLGRWEEALGQAREVAEARAEELGPAHPDTVSSHREAGAALGRLERWEEALTVYRRIADARESALGERHPEALAAREDEAYCLVRLGRGEQAAALRRRVAALRGAEHAPPPS